MHVSQGLKSMYENQDFGSLVPEGRLKVVQGGVATYFQSSLRDWSSFQDQPRTRPGLSSSVPRDPIPDGRFSRRPEARYFQSFTARLTGCGKPDSLKGTAFRPSVSDCNCVRL